MGTDIYLVAERLHKNSWEFEGELDELEIRNYEFFAILANVRNPIRSTTPYVSITCDRGFPADLSEAAKNESLLVGGHNPGWVTFRELLNFDWDGMKMTRTAVVDPSMLHAFADGKFHRELLTGFYGLADQGPGPRVTWSETYREAVGKGFLEQIFERLRRIGEPDEVRVVFSFDS